MLSKADGNIIHLNNCLLLRHLFCLYNTFKQRNILKFNKGEEMACWKTILRNYPSVSDNIS